MFLDKWEKRIKKEIEGFTSEWNWELVFRVWNDRISHFATLPQPLFTPVLVHDPQYPLSRENILSWWSTEHIRELQIDFQRHLDRYPGTIGPYNPYELQKGAMDTLKYLWAYKEDRSKIAAILISASLFSRLKSSRINYPRDNWPAYFPVAELYKLAYNQWNGKKTFYTWQHYHTEVLPYISFDYRKKLKDIKALIRYLAEEHAQVFLEFRPVSIEFESKYNPFLRRVLDNEYKLQREKTKAFEEKLAREKQQFENKRNNLWDNISEDELERLVWSKPTIELARELGVSDVAISKRCKSLGISKPNRGFWAKVKAGKIENPKGEPMK